MKVFSKGLIRDDCRKRESTSTKGEVDNGEKRRGDFVGYFLENSSGDGDQGCSVS